MEIKGKVYCFFEQSGTFKNEFKKFQEKIKLKISNDYNIPADKIVIASPKKGGFHIQLIFQRATSTFANVANFKEGEE